MFQSYQLVLKIPQTLSLEIKTLGKFNLPAGYYIYTGSAVKNMEARIRRHLQKDKKVHWHVDHLTTHPSDVRRSDIKECLLNQQVDGKVIVDKFGASDCGQNCNSHLKFIGPIE